ncbi:hypothetical protein BJ322DRAFT_1095473 [Thelephora terrestris]|uniref:Uncharacterized protein n=1 Tax=Thelephora terrestris TaxID=56493 RepID=A0A9P6H1Z0_9AGAM|nr:hypothetical protein BJ322DRAFT_1095473 [Thelephora terrestris]
MSSHSEMSTIYQTRYNPAQEYFFIQGREWVAPFYPDTYMGPWGWQWRNGVHNLVSTPPSPTSITIRALMDDIEKDAPGAHRTITDLAFSRSSECPFIVDEAAMSNLRSRLRKFGNENAFLSPDAQVGMRKSIAAALGEMKSLVPEREAHAVIYPYSVDVLRLVDGLCGPRLLPQSLQVDELDGGSGTMSMDLGTEDDTPSTPSELPSQLKVVGSGICKKVVGAEAVDGRTM